MSRTVLLAVLCLIVGGVVGNSISRAVAQRHQHTHAVMWLALVHLQRLERAAQARPCQNLAEEFDSLGHLQRELVQAFPQAYRQDAEFRARADALATALRAAIAGGADCASAARRVGTVRDACDACHREYR